MHDRPRAVFPIRDALGVDGPLVCCGGGLILSGKNRMADSRLTHACAQSVLQETQARGIHLSVYRDLDWFIAAEDEWSRAEAQITGVQPTVAPLETLFADWGDAGAHKLLCMGEKSQIDEMIPVLEAKHLPMTLVRSKDEYLEVVPAGAGKDTAMARCAKRWASHRTRSSHWVTMTSMHRCCVPPDWASRWETPRQRRGQRLTK